MRWQARLIWGFLILGVVARAVRFLLRFPLWEDECFLAANFIDRDLFRPAGAAELPSGGSAGVPLGRIDACQVVGLQRMVIAAVPVLGERRKPVSVPPFGRAIAPGNVADFGRGPVFGDLFRHSLRRRSQTLWHRSVRGAGAAVIGGRMVASARTSAAGSGR